MTTKRLISTLALATAGIDIDLLSEDFDASSHLVEQDSVCETYILSHDRLGLLVRLGDIEKVSDLGFDPKTGKFAMIVSKEGADTAQIMAQMPWGYHRIASIRPTTMGMIFISGDLLEQLMLNEKFAAGIRQLFASGYIPAEGVSFRHNTRSVNIETVVLDLETMEMAQIMIGETPVRLCAIVQGRLLLATDRSVLLTKRLSASMMVAVAQGIIRATFLHGGSKVGLRAAPVTIVTNGASTILGLQDGTNIAIRVEPDGSIKVDGTDSATGKLLSLFARVAERDTETAIAERDGRMTRVPIASLPSGFRHTAGIPLGNGHGRAN